MALKDQISGEVGYPAAVGVLVVVCTVALLFFWSHRRSFHVSLKSGSGTKYVREGGDRVRRSTRWGVGPTLHDSCKPGQLQI